MLNKIGERRNSWRIPTEVWKKSLWMLFWRTALLESSCNCFDDLNDVRVEVEVLHDIPQGLVPFTIIECFLEVDEVMVEDTLVLQMFTISNLMLKICSTVLLFGRNPSCSSAFSLIRFRRTLNITLLW